MWWLTFLNGGVVIIEASSLIHARSLAAAHGLGRVVHFAEGHFINPESAALIPDDSAGCYPQSRPGGCWTEWKVRRDHQPDRFIHPITENRSEGLPSPTAPSRLGLYKPRLRIVSLS